MLFLNKQIKNSFENKIHKHEAWTLCLNSKTKENTYERTYIVWLNKITKKKLVYYYYFFIIYLKWRK